MRAKCPECRAYTAVALGPEYECHGCGRTFAAGLVRVPRAWGRDGEPMAEAASLPLPYPEAAVIEEDSLAEQSLALALELPERPLVLGGCCCAHIGAVEALSARHGRVGVVWFDAHGDLNTIESSPSGNEWATPLRMLLDSGAVEPHDVALVGARNLDPP
jgi:arginase family enzyme